MTDNESVAAVLAAGMLQPISPPARGSDGSIPQQEQSRFVLDVLHAVALYRAVLESLDQTNMRRVRIGDSMSAPAANGDGSTLEYGEAAMPPHLVAPVPAVGLRPVK